MREKLVLIDGHSILNRAFYGLPDLTNSEGMHTNAVYGFFEYYAQDPGRGETGLFYCCF